MTVKDFNWLLRILGTSNNEVLREMGLRWQGMLAEVYFRRNYLVSSHHLYDEKFLPEILLSNENTRVIRIFLNEKTTSVGGKTDSKSGVGDDI